MKRKRAYATMARRITILTLGLWLLAMGLLTWAVAADMDEQIQAKTQQYAADLGDRDVTGNNEILEKLPGNLEAGMIDSLGLPYYWLDLDPLLPIMTKSNGVGSKDWIWGKWDLYYGLEPTVAFFDENGEVLMSSGNYLTFVYTSEENWRAQNTAPMSHGYLDLDAIPGGVETFSPILGKFAGGSVGAGMFVPLMRMTGYFEGVGFHPVSVDRGGLIYSFSRDIPQLCSVDSRGDLSWENMLTLENNGDQELVTIYAWEISGILFDSDPVTVEGIRYDSVPAFLEVIKEKWGGFDSNTLIESVFVWSRGQEDAHGPYTFALAVRYWPLLYAATRLGPAYLVSLAVTLVLLWLVLRSIRRNLTKPLEELADKISRNAHIEPDADWAEPRALQEYYETTRQTLHENETQIAQLNTALEYAKNAEESRRQLVSNITHELKTPLAVIHSYAEGLQADIAAEKKEHYLNVILEESEKMDAMVLQMLDLSRLEAGRVRLRSDAFSLLAMARRVAEKMEPLARAKGLELQWEIAQDFTVTADESRMEQVITNLMGNALKYAPADTHVSAGVFSHMGQAYFRMENQSPHLSEEALEKVWDSFYRADPSRTEPGTGLGLTIVKTIVELHRGSCSVRNTTIHEGEKLLTAVEFGFRIPL